jgi:hypothetical protein
MNRRPSESRTDVRPAGSITVEEPAPSPFAAVSLMLVFLVAVLGLWASVYLLPGT